MPGTILGDEDTLVTKTDQNSINYTTENLHQNCITSVS